MEMSDLKAIERQVKLEEENVAYGLKKLRKQTQKLEDQNYASASVYGNSFVSELMPRLVEHLANTEHRIKTRRNGAMYKEISFLLEQLSKEEASLIALKVFIDNVFSSDDDRQLVANLYSVIGSSIEAECKIRYFKEHNGGLFNYIQKKHWHPSMGTKQKVVTTQTLINRLEDTAKFPSWSRETKVKIGAWYVDAICTITGWFDQKRTKKGASYLIANSKCWNYRDELMGIAEMFCPLVLPMVCEPMDWTPDWSEGGYYTNELTRLCKGIRGPMGKGLSLPREPLEFLNKIQKVPFRVNTFVADVLEVLWERGHEIKKFKPLKSAPVVPKPFDIEDNAEARKGYCRQRAQIENEHRSYLKKTVRTKSIMEVVRRFRDEEKIYFPWSFDYRGRVYPIPPFLQPQGTDVDKACLQFYDSAFLTPEAEDWLAFQVATTYGLDKSPMHERLQWAKDNHSLIHAVAQDPIGTIPQWEVADEPFQFLAACEEYNACLIDCTRHHTHLPIAVDASCSGIQILSGLARDKNAAKLVNVTPSDRVQDAYAVIAEASKPHIPDELKPIWNRKIVKRTVMTVPYNAKPHSNRGYIRDALWELYKIKVEPDVLTELVKAVRDAINNEIPGPMQVMAWIEKEVGNAFKRGETQLKWTTPSGFVVNQKIQKFKLHQVKTMLFGETKKVYLAHDIDEPNVNKHKCATAPNLIHSLDASLLHLTVLRWDAPIALIHDSVLCRATDMSSLNTIIRETYKHLFAENDFLTDFAKQIGAETEPPIIGDLKPENVMASTYFFS